MNPLNHRQMRKTSGNSVGLRKHNNPFVVLTNGRSVQCYSTCVVGAPFDGTVPFQCCADSILDQPISQTVDPNYVIFRIYDPNSPGEDDYRLNAICK